MGSVMWTCNNWWVFIWPLPLDQGCETCDSLQRYAARAHTHTHTHARAHCTHTRARAHTHTRTHTHACAHAHTHAHAHAHTHARARSHTRAHTRARAHARTHARAHTHTHTHSACSKCWTQCQSGWVQKISLPPRFDTQTIHPLASHFTDYNPLAKSVCNYIPEF